MQIFCFIHQKLKVSQIFDKLTDDTKYTDIWIHNFKCFADFYFARKKIILKNIDTDFILKMLEFKTGS